MHRKVCILMIENTSDQSPYFVIDALMFRVPNAVYLFPYRREVDQTSTLVLTHSDS